MNRLDRLRQDSWLRGLVRCSGLLCLTLIVAASIARTTAAIAGMPEAEAAYNRGDFNAAFSEAKPLAEQGNAAAEGLLGALYRDGKGVLQDNTQALSWLRKAAGQGDDGAKLLLWQMYSSAQGVTFQWVKESAEHGDAAAQMALATMYGGGQGVPSDLVQAYVWLSIVANNASAGTGLGATAGIMVAAMRQGGMTPQQITEGDRRVREWKAKPGASQ